MQLSGFFGLQLFLFTVSPVGHCIFVIFLIKVFILFVNVKICNVCIWKDSRCCRFSKPMCSCFYLDFFCLSLHSFSCTKSLKLITKESSLGVFPGQENSPLNMKCRVSERGMKRKHSM